MLDPEGPGHLRDLKVAKWIGLSWDYASFGT